MRLDRFLTLNIARPLRALMARFSPSPRWEKGGGGVLPILMYHSVSADPEPELGDYFKLCVSPSRFRAHLRWLKQHGYVGTTISAGLAWLNDASPSPPRGLELLGKRRKEFATGEGPRRAEGAGASESLGRGEVLPSVLRPLSSDCRPLSSGGNSSLSAGGEGRGEVAAATVNPSVSSSSALRPLSSRPVVLTFDDGFHDFYTEALPILVEEGFSATVYLPTEFIGESGSRRPFRPGNSSCPSTLNSQPATARNCLTWDEVAECRRRGITFGSHTVSHPKLYEMEWREIRRELKESRQVLEDRLGETIDAFCYPFAFPEADRAFVAGFREVLGECGYRTNTTTCIGRASAASDLLQLPRLPVNDKDDETFFAAKMSGDYDWLARPQTTIKRIKHRRPSSPPVFL